MKVPNVLTPKELINVAFARARKKAIHKKKLLDREMLRIDISANIVLDELHGISILEIDNLKPFYRDLVEATIDTNQLKNSLNKLRWAKRKILQVKRFYLRGYQKLEANVAISRRKVFYGRLNSVLKGIEKDLEFIKDACSKMADLPSIKEMPCVIIAGYPNAGKSSLLKALTGSEPEIKPYPFTTKGLMLGYSRLGYHKVQFIDTPGLLDRPFDKMNPIERRAIAALRHLNAVVVFVIDPLYNIEGQANLLAQVRSALEGDMIVVLNKAVLEFDRASVTEKIPGLFVSAMEGTGIVELKAEIAKLLKT